MSVDPVQPLPLPIPSPSPPPVAPGPLPAPASDLLAAAPTPETFWHEYWPHITAAAGGVIAVAIGVGDHFFGPSTGPQAWGPLLDVSFVWAGLAALGVTAVAAAK